MIDADPKHVSVIAYPHALPRFDVCIPQLALYPPAGIRDRRVVEIATHDEVIALQRFDFIGDDIGLLRPNAESLSHLLP